MNWITNPDGDNNEKSTFYKNRKITIYSNKAEDHWFYYLDDYSNEVVDGYKIEEEAAEAAIEEIGLN